MPQRFLWVVIAAGYMGLLLAQPIADAWDDLSTNQPWFSAEISLKSGGMIEYRRTIRRWQRGEWTAVVQVPDGPRWRGVCSNAGRFTYRPSMSGTTRMSFGYFTGGCTQPAGRHRVCVDYVMRDSRERQRGFGPFCATHTGE